MHRIIGLWAFAWGAWATTAVAAPTVVETEATLVNDFTLALETYGAGFETLPAKPQVKVWLDGLRERGIDASVIQRRLQRAKARAVTEGIDPFAKYRRIEVEQFDTDTDTVIEAELGDVALHAFRIDVIEDYDDVYNDDIYAYFITTHDDLVWGKVSSIYTGLDEGDSFFFSPTDRGLFGPTGEKLSPRRHTLVDFGIVESDSGDIQQLKQLSDAIVDLALVALSIYDPQAGAAAAQARAETQNLLRLIIEMDDDDRLVTDTLRFTPASMQGLLGGNSYAETSLAYDREDFWTHFAYRIHFRLLR